MILPANSPGRRRPGHQPDEGGRPRAFASRADRPGGDPSDIGRPRRGRCRSRVFARPATARRRRRPAARIPCRDRPLGPRAAGGVGPIFPRRFARPGGRRRLGRLAGADGQGPHRRPRAPRPGGAGRAVLPRELDMHDFGVARNCATYPRRGDSPRGDPSASLPRAPSSRSRGRPGGAGGTADSVRSPGAASSTPRAPHRDGLRASRSGLRGNIHRTALQWSRKEQLRHFESQYAKAANVNQDVADRLFHCEA